MPLAGKGMYKSFDSSKRASSEVAELLAAEKELERKQAESGLPVHLLDVHLKKGMHCVDCHFVQDVHGNGRLHQEVRAATEIQCIDRHGTAEQYTTLWTSGVASYTSAADSKGRDLAAIRTP